MQSFALASEMLSPQTGAISLNEYAVDAARQLKKGVGRIIGIGRKPPSENVRDIVMENGAFFGPDAFQHFADRQSLLVDVVDVNNGPISAT